MRLRYHELLGKRVLAADGRLLGHVADLTAEPRGGALRVTGLRVGATALLRRITFRRSGDLRLQPREIPWALVARVDRDIHLRVDHAAAEAVIKQGETRDAREEPPE